MVYGILHDVRLKLTCLMVIKWWENDDSRESRGATKPSATQVHLFLPVREVKPICMRGSVLGTRTTQCCTRENRLFEVCI